MRWTPAPTSPCCGLRPSDLRPAEIGNSDENWRSAGLRRSCGKPLRPAARLPSGLSARSAGVDSSWGMPACRVQRLQKSGRRRQLTRATAEARSANLKGRSGAELTLPSPVIPVAARVLALPFPLIWPSSGQPNGGGPKGPPPPGAISSVNLDDSFDGRKRPNGWGFPVPPVPW